MHPAGSPPTAERAVPANELIKRLIESATIDLRSLTRTLPNKADVERKVALTTFSERYRHLFGRLFAALKWSKQLPFVQTCLVRKYTPDLN